jgi:hypothetical protein
MKSFQMLGIFEYAPAFGKSVMKLAPTPITAASSSTIWKGSWAGPSWRIIACLAAGAEVSMTDWLRACQQHHKSKMTTKDHKLEKVVIVFERYH